MSNKNIMESKITIHTGVDYKPVIKVVEKHTDDVRDQLVQAFRELLSHKSKTLMVEFTDSSYTFGNSGRLDESQSHISYLVVPVEDELNYFKRRIFDSIPEESKSEYLSDTIHEFFEKIKKLTK